MASKPDPRSVGEHVRTAFDQPVTNIRGKRLVTKVIDYEPGGQSPPHRHAPSAFIHAHVISGAVRSQMEGTPEQTYREGETWYEDPGCHTWSAPMPATTSRRACSRHSWSMKATTR